MAATAALKSAREAPLLPHGPEVFRIRAAGVDTVELEAPSASTFALLATGGDRAREEVAAAE